MKVEWKQDGLIATVAPFPPEKLMEAIELCIKAVKAKYKDCPVDVQAMEWDQSYGDILNEGFVWAMPQRGLWSAEKRFGIKEAAHG